MKTESKIRLTLLMEIESLSHELIYSEYSTTSQHFQSWCDAYDEAKLLIRLVKCGSLESYLEKWAPETLAKLRSHLFQE